MKRLFSLTFFILFNLINPAWALECSTDQIEVKQFDVNVEDPCLRTPCPQVRIIGELLNGCKIPVGVQIQLVARDAEGKVVDSREGWPASNRNIPAGESYPFNLNGYLDYSDRIKNVSISVVEVYQW